MNMNLFLTLKHFEKYLIHHLIQISVAAERFHKEMTNPRPFIPFQLKLFCSTKKETKPMYDILIFSKIK